MRTEELQLELSADTYARLMNYVMDKIERSTRVTHSQDDIVEELLVFALDKKEEKK